MATYKSKKLEGKSKERTRHFPQFFRKIPAPRTISVQGWRLVVALLIGAILLLQLAYLGQTLYQHYQEAQAKQAEKTALEAEIINWEKIARDKPNYRDAYFELAVLSYKLNRIDDAKQYLEKVFSLDPNFEPARELEKILRD